MSNKKFRPPVERFVPDTATSSAPLDLSIAGKSVGPLPDDDARAMLARAARCLDCFITKAHAALEKVSPERLAAAALELDRTPTADAPQHTDPRKRPRGAPDPLVVLLKLIVGAARTLRRILPATNPVIFGVLNPLERDLMASLKHTEGFVAGLQEAGKLAGIEPR
ncbi:MAG: hypothetical protein H6841_03100 [Planctomycetes bacterium]|nr:hypothetical protein [Planctomycetota bacterium]MCB9934106.1 hypothetical protein [Planctomycetota bacterium]